MTIFLFFVGVIQCFVVWSLGQAGIGLAARTRKDWELAQIAPPGGWPDCAMIIPVSGQRPGMGTALRSLLEQNYDNYQVFLVTATEDDPVMPLVEELCEEFDNATHVTAGLAAKCGQKNHNLLAGVRAAGPRWPIYIFCDSTHEARPDFLRCIVGPIARGEAAFTTGYHQVMPRDDGIITLAYALNVMCMRFLQGMALLTQPWGGAMAMQSAAFARYEVACLWQNNVVDDCSLGAWLAKRGAHVRLCAGAILETYAQRHAFAVWRAWLERQILFLKFCMPGQWFGLGVFCLIMAAPPIWFCVAIFKGILGLGGGMAPFLALCWFFTISWAIGGWRRFFSARPGFTRWLWAFFFSCLMFGGVYIFSIFRRSILWQNVVYQVGAHGVVRSMQRR